MPEAEARALSAGGPLVITIAGKECQVKPLGIRELTEVERDCLERYRRQCLETYAANLDLLPEQARVGWMERKLDEVSRWDVDSLPMKFAHDPTRVLVTDALKQWLIEHWDLGLDTIEEKRLRQLAAASLDQDTLSEEEYRKLVGSPPPKVKVPYVHWWITGCYDGMVTLIWTCFRHANVTREQVIDTLGNDLTKLSELSREIEKLSAPQSGNG